MTQIPFWDHRDPFVRIYHDLILISCLPINMALTRAHREFLEVFLTQHHKDKHIVVRAMDGENLRDLGFLELLETFCVNLGITPDRVTVISSMANQGPWQWRASYPMIFWSADEYMGKELPLPHDHQQIFGINIGRFNPLRHKILRVLDHKFGPDIFMTCNYTLDEVRQFYSSVTDHCHDDINWMANKVFASDDDLPGEFRDNGTIPWYTAYELYVNLAKHFTIDIVVETDFNNPAWFTEKTSKCLYAGKPFLLIAGPGSLRRLQEMGFHTFGAVIDETYDDATSFQARLDAVCIQMQRILEQPNKTQLLNDMINIALYNRQNWQRLKNRNWHQ